MDDLSQFKDTYITECFELLEQMESGLMALDPEAAIDKEELNAIFRCAHSIKGGAGAFGFNHIAGFTHILEALLDEMREERITVTAKVVDCLLRARDIVYQMVQAAQNNDDSIGDLGSDVVNELVSFSCVLTPQQTQSTSGTQASPKANKQSQGEQCYQIHFVPQRDMIRSGNEPLLLLRELASLGEATIECNCDQLPSFEQLEADECFLSWHIMLTTEQTEERIYEVFEFVEDECELTVKRQPAEAGLETQVAAAPKTIGEQPATKSAEPKAKSSAATPSIRVDIDKVDALINMVGEIVITQSFISSQIAQLETPESSDLVRGISDMLHHIRELQEAVMSVRMQPVKSIFARMPRLVRDLSAQLGKDIVLQMQGEETEVDKTIIEQLADPLTHMIRNSVDHGIEMPEWREMNGKNAQGNIRLSAEHRGGRIVIEIEDDGAGINREKVREKAIEKGVIEADASLSDEAIDMLIFAPGFSTAAQVSNISGRGVGMDVVKRNIEGLGGVVSVENRPSQGSVFGISLPLTLAILDGMIVRCGQEQYIIPINHIIETMRPKSGEVKPMANSQQVVNVRGDFVPILYLHELLNISGAQHDPSQALVVLVENGNEHLGLVVDELIGQQQVVIKSLEENADPIEGISGATILGDGKVSLILDIAALHQLNSEHRSRMKQSTELPADSFAA